MPKKRVLLLLIVTVFTLSVALQGCSLRAGREVEAEVVTFGSYPQSVLTDTAVITALDKGIESGDIAADEYGRYLYGGNYYAAVTAAPNNKKLTYSNGNKAYGGEVLYFLYQPIEWYVLLSSSGVKLLLACTALDVDVFSVSYAESDSTHAAPIITGKWADSSLRKRLNEQFVSVAFTEAEQSLLRYSVVDNATTNGDSTVTGADTRDRVFLPAYTEVYNTGYGFTSAEEYSPLRCAYATDYVIAKGGKVTTDRKYKGNCSWWLRSATSQSGYASYVSEDGTVSVSGAPSNSGGYALRPCIWIISE